MKSMLADQMNNMLAEGGVMQEGGTVDPVSGNEVPVGAMQEEVRDDIDAKLSEGEFVFPADVVRFIGLQTLMKLRDKAKMGLQRMNDIGQMGNAEEVPDGEALFGDEEMDDDMFSSEIDSIMAEDEGGNEDREYKDGGYVVPENQQRYSNAPIRGFEMVPMVNDVGQTIFIPFINGVAQLRIPSGYKFRTAGTVDAPVDQTPTTPAAPNQDGGGGGDGASDGGSGGSTTSGPGFSIGEDGFAVADTTNATAAGLVGTVTSMMTGLPGLNTLGKAIAEQSNFSNAQAAMGFNVAVSDTTAAANNEGITSAAATPGAAGTGGAAASAASSAAAAATAAGHSDAAIGAASQAAADAAIGGASAADAAAAGAAAAGSADSSVGMAADANAVGGGFGDTSSVGDSGGDSGGVSGISSDGIGFAKGGFVNKRKSEKTGKSTSFVTRQK
jgi:hypothetical protein